MVVVVVSVDGGTAAAVANWRTTFPQAYKERHISQQQKRKLIEIDDSGRCFKVIRAKLPFINAERGGGGEKGRWGK